MTLDIVEQWVRRAGAVAVSVCLIAALAGMVRGLCQPRGRMTGLAGKVMQPLGYLLIGMAYFGTWFVLWRPLPLALSLSARIVALTLGALLYFPSLALYLWARLTLGEMYNVSTSFGAQLYSEHRLITRGPYSFVRHPMYLGVLAAALGGLLIYRTWTALFVIATFLSLFRRAQREERVLAAEFDEQWQEYCQQVPGWIPRISERR
jgi:protein-S-isoprenylcysteine O-methyltransferase Ste14